MNTFDLTPFYRHSIGFDHLENIFDSMIKLNDVSDNYPPYNIQSNGKDNYTSDLFSTNMLCIANLDMKLIFFSYS